MSEAVAIATFSAPSTKAHVYLPLLAAVDLLEATLRPFESTRGPNAILAGARAALVVLADSMPDPQEVLDEFLSDWGTLSSKYSRAQNEAWRHGSHDAQLTDTLCKEALGQIRALFHALASTTHTAEAAYAQVEAQAALLNTALDEAQKDGWGRGDYVSEAREEATSKFDEVIKAAAHQIMVS
jgi:hypothetical protein